MNDVLTIEDIRRAVKAMEQIPREKVYVENEYWYKSYCKFFFGESISEKEIAKAKRNKNGYIKQLRGVKLYLSVPLKTNLRGTN